MSSRRRTRWLALAAVVVVAAVGAVLIPPTIRSGVFHRGASALRHRVLGNTRPEPRPHGPIPVTANRLTAGRRIISLSNRHTDELFALSEGDRRIAEGTPVAIVYAGTLEDAHYKITN